MARPTARARDWSANRPDTMLEIQILPARQGDAIWVRWKHDGMLHQLIVDMGTREAGERFRERLEDLPADQRTFELLVVTHIDSDHIGGVLSCLVEPPEPAVRFKDIWFNGANHCTECDTTDDRSFAEGHTLMEWLTEGERPWNQCFTRRRVARRDGIRPRIVELPGMKVHVLGPPANRLLDLGEKWWDELAIFEGRDVEEQYTAAPIEMRSEPALDDDVALGLLAKTPGNDRSLPNGSSIALLLECAGNRVLLSGDAFAGDLVDGLTALGEGPRVRVDAFKLPHHGSKQNVTEDLIKSVNCPLYIFSSDGTRHRHPDNEAVACVIAHGRSVDDELTLAFNERSTSNQWWSNTEWHERFKFTAVYGSATDGLTLEFPEKTSSGSPNSR